MANEPNQYVQRANHFNRPRRTGYVDNPKNNIGVIETQPPIIADRLSDNAIPPSDNNANVFTATPSTMIRQPIGKDQVRKGAEILKKYKQGRSKLEDKIVRNEKWFKMRHWDLLKTEEMYEDPKPASGWLFNTIISKHADYMDSYPTSDILPREQGDVEEADRLSSIIPVIMEQNDYRNVFSDESWYKLKNGTGVYGVFWDKDKLNGLGDILIKCMDLLSIFWEAGVTDIQESENLFTVELVSNKRLEAEYPQCQGQLKKTNDTIVKKYWYDDKVDTTGKSAVIDWYYKKKVGTKKVLHYIKFVDDIVLYATENDPAAAERGLYDHGMYPFVFDPLFPEAGMPVGFGFIDVCKNAQTSIDVYNNAFEKNVQFVCSPRYIVRNDGGINEDEFSNPHQLLIHTDGNLGEDSIAPVNTPTFINSNYISILDQKVTEMKETAGNRDATTGGTQAGVTAASAIAAMQESAGKTSRDQIARTYEAHKKVVNLVIELIRQFYDMPRQFRIIGSEGQQEFVTYTNAGMQPEYQGMEYGVDMGYRLPVFDIEVKAEKENAYSQLSQNELALQFYNQGFFNPQYADQALACIDMMEFKGKSMVVSKIQENGGMYQQMLQLQQQLLQLSEMVDGLSGGQTQMADSTASAINERMGALTNTPNGSEAKMPKSSGEASVTANARERANSATAPR